MQELLQQLLKEIQGAWRFRWHALAFAWVAAIMGWCAVLLTPNVYESQAKVFVDTESLLKPLLSGLAVTTNLTSQVTMMSAVLMARPNIERVAKDTDLYLRARTAEDLDRLLAALPKQVSLAADRDSTYTIAYRDHDPRMAHRVVRRFLDTFVEDTIDVKREDSAGTEEFLRTRIKEYEQKLREAEDRRAEFKKQNIGVMPGETGDYYTRLQTALATQRDLQASLRIAQDKKVEVQRQLEGEEPTFGLSPNGPTGPSGPNDALIAQYRAQLEALLVQYTDKHPQVITLRETIAKLEEENRKAVAAGQSALPQTVDPSTAGAAQARYQSCLPEHEDHAQYARSRSGGIAEQAGDTRRPGARPARQDEYYSRGRGTADAPGSRLRSHQCTVQSAGPEPRACEVVRERPTKALT